MSELDEKDEPNEIKEIDKLMKSKTVIIECSKVTNPLLAVLAVAKEYKLDEKFQALMENQLSKWLESHPELYRSLENVKQDKIYNNCKILTYHKEIATINKCIRTIKNAMSKYLDGTCYYKMDNSFHVIAISDKNNDEFIPMEAYKLGECIYPFINQKISNDKVDNHQINLFPELVDIICPVIIEMKLLFNLGVEWVIEFDNCDMECNNLFLQFYKRPYKPFIFERFCWMSEFESLIFEYEGPRSMLRIL